MKRTIILFFIILTWFTDNMAQVNEKDTTAIHEVINKNIHPNQNPKKAAWLSAILPGAGQIYNRKYWKTGLLYAGIAGTIFVLRFNDKRYQMYRNAYTSRLNGDTILDPYNDKNLLSNEPKYSDADLIILKDFYRRDRDFSYIILAVIYFCNIADAAVDAHLMQTEINDNLLLSFRPDVIIQNQYCIFAPVITIDLKKYAHCSDRIRKNGYGD